MHWHIVINTMNIFKVRYIILLLGAFLINSCDDDTNITSNSSDSSNYSNYTIDSTKKIKLNVGIEIETGDLILHWTIFDDATMYELEGSFTEYYIGSFYVYRGPSNNYYIGHPPPWPIYYYRVRALFTNTVSLWSNIVRIP